MKCNHHHSYGKYQIVGSAAQAAGTGGEEARLRPRAVPRSCGEGSAHRRRSHPAGSVAFQKEEEVRREDTLLEQSQMELLMGTYYRMKEEL